MVLQCKKGKYFATGEVFPLDIGLLMGAIISGQAWGDFTLTLVWKYKLFGASEMCG